MIFGGHFKNTKIFGHKYKIGSNLKIHYNYSTCMQHECLNLSFSGIVSMGSVRMSSGVVQPPKKFFSLF